MNAPSQFDIAPTQTKVSREQWPAHLECIDPSSES